MIQIEQLTCFVLWNYVVINTRKKSQKPEINNTSGELTEFIQNFFNVCSSNSRFHKNHTMVYP